MDKRRNTPEHLLAQPARARAFAYLSELRRPATIEEIAGHLGLHPAGVRTHLSRLEDAGLVERRVVRRSRGRPHYEWTVASGAMPEGHPPEAHGQLASWLAGAFAAGATTAEALERYGEGIGRALAPEVARGTPAQTLDDVLAAMGFQPQRRTADGVTAYELRNCPYRRAVRAGGRHVCALHAGITRGLLERLAPDARMTGFVAKDPDRAGCLVEVAGLEPPS